MAMIGASRSRFQRNAPRRMGGSVMSQNRAVSAPSSTTRCQPCVLPALGAREPSSTISSSSSRGTGRVSNARVIRRERTTSGSSGTAWRLVPGAELDEVLGHRPAVHDERAAGVLRDGREELLARRVDRLRPRRLEVDEALLAIGVDHERLLVVLGLALEALGEAAPPGALLADGPRAGARGHVV